MRCLYCGKELALFKRLRGGEFCSDAHRQRYQEEYTQLALNRLLQANSSKDSNEANETSEKDTRVSAVKTAPSVNGKEPKPEVNKRADLNRSDSNKNAEPIESPAMKRRDRLKEEAPAPTRRVAASLPAPAAPTLIAENLVEEPVEEPAEVTEMVAAPEPELEQVSEEVAEEAAPEPEFEPEPEPPPMSGLLVEIPVPVFANVAEMSKPEMVFVSAGETLFPQAQEAPGAIDRTLSLVGHVESLLPGEVDWLAPRQRALEVREFVRSVPVVEIPLKPAGETDLPSFEEPLEISFEPYPVDVAAVLALESVCEFPPPGIEFGPMTRLDFDPTAWGDETAAAEPAVAEPEAPQQATRLAPEQPLPASQNSPVALESSRMELLRVDPVHFESPRPRPFHFEAVQIHEVFAEPISAEPEESSPQAPANAAPEEPPALQVPEAVTRPEPVTLHGIAPLRGKPAQVFASALPRDVEILSPRQSSLPLRPVMVFGPAVVPAPEVKAPVAPSIPEKPVPEKLAAEKQEPRAPLPRRKPEVRVLSLPVKAEPKPAQPTPKPEIRPIAAKPVEPKPVEAKPVEAAKVEIPKPVEAKPLEAKPAVAKAKEPPKAEPQKQAIQKEAVKEAVKKDEPRKPAPAPAPQDAAAPAEPAYRPAPLNPAPPIPDLLGLPTLSLENQGSAWSRIPVMLRVGIAAAVLAAAGAGVLLTSHGSGATNPKGSKPAPQAVVEAGPALATTAGWIQDWFTDPRGAKNARHVDVLRGSLTARDYRLEMEGQIDQGAIGWVFRANNKSFYAEKVAVIKPGLEPGIALVRIAVIDGQEVMREQLPLNLKVHLDTQYKIRVDAVGHRFTTWVQDQQVDDWNDSRIEAGGVGLYYDSGDSAHLKGTLNVIPLKEK